MADEPNWQPAQAPPWAKQAEPNWQPAEAPPWAERGVLQRAGESAAERFMSGVEHAKELVTKKPEPGAVGALENLKTTALGLLSPLEMTVGAATAGILSPAASLAGWGTRKAEEAIAAGTEAVGGTEVAKRMRKRIPGAEKAHEDWLRNLELATMAAGRPMAPGARVPVTPAAVPAKTNEALAGRVIEQSATNPEAVRQSLATTPRELVPGSEPTTAQLTGDLGLQQLERVSSRGEGAAAFKELEQQQNTARVRALEQAQTTGSPSDVVEHLRNSLRAQDAEAERNLRSAQQQAWEASQQVGGTYDPTTYGNIFRREIAGAEEAKRASERQLWEVVDPDGTLMANPQRIQELERGVYAGMTEAGAASITPTEKTISDLIQGYRPIIPFRELTDLRSLVSTALREELVTRGQTPTYARLSRLRQGIESAVEQSVFDAAGTAQAGAAMRLRAASAATRERAETFRPLRDITRREGVAGPYRMGEAAVPGRIVQPGAKGYDSVSNYLRAVGAQRGLPELQDAIAATMRRDAIGPDGVVNPRKLEGWFRRHEGVLRAIDERDGGAFSQTLRNAGQAQEVVRQAEARQAATTAQWESQAFKSLIGSVDDEQTTRVIGGIFDKVDAPQRMRDLMSRLTTSEAQAGARRAVIDYFRARFTSNAPAGLQDNMLRAEQLQNFMKDPVRIAALRQVLTPEQLRMLQAVAADIRRMNTSVTSKIRGGSDTVQNIAQFGKVAQLTMRIADGLIGHVLGVRVPGGRMLGHGLRAALGWYESGKIKRIGELVDRAMVDPDFAADLLSKTEQAPGLPKSYIGYEAGNVTNPQPAARQAGGGVPALGGTGGRSPGTTTPARARAARQRTSQALQDGGAARDQAGPTIKPGTREHWAALISSPVHGGPVSSGAPRGKAPTGVSRNDIVEMLKRRGISGEGAGSFSDYSPESHTFQEGGEVKDEDEKLPLPGQSIGLGKVPVITNRAGETLPEYIAKAWGRGAADWAMTPGRAYKEGLTPEEEADWAASTAGQLAGRGMTQPAPGIGIFGGIGAKTANTAMLDKALRMHAAGADPTSIWNQTGWFRGAEGKWRFEIPDVEARLKELDPEYLQRLHASGSMGPTHRFSPDLREVVEHPEFFRAYPEMKAVTGEVVVDPHAQSSQFGFWQPPHQTLTGIEPPYIHATGRDVDLALSSTLHEMQHGVQNVERFAPGSSRELAAKVLGPTASERAAADLAATKGLTYSDLHPLEKRQFRNQAAAMAYLAHAGETEARNVQRRWERGISRAPPWRTEDVAREKQIIPTGQKRKRFIRGEPVKLEMQQGGSVEDEKPEAPPLPKGLTEAWGDPFERAAYRQARAVRPRSFTEEGRTEGTATQALEKAGESVIPQSPSDYALMALGGPWGRAAKVGAVGLAALLESLSPAEAGKIKTLMELGIDPAYIRRILTQTKEKGGGSFSMTGGPAPTEGRMMGVLPNEHNIVVPSGEALKRPELEDYIRRNWEKLQAENRYLGTWRDPKTGMTYVDISERFDPKQLRTATKFGERTGQISGYDIGADKPFPVGNWWEFISSPEYRQRLREMAEEGRSFLAQHPSKEWWDLHGTSLERVYGPENLPAVAGYTAATAPRTKIVPNLRQMTEYMRRQLAGEPVVQPSWRVPEGALSMQPGGQMPLEASRVANLERVRRGALGELSSTKVADEAKAFLGDPNVGPIDVHHIRLGEAPERGIYAATQPGEIETTATKAMGVAPYDFQQAQIADEARNQGRTLRDYSADVWTGITETIRRTNQLYGAPFRGSMVGGGEGYADQFSKILEQAAKKLGMDQDKLEHQLRSGDSSLLSWLLVSSPAFYAAYRQWQAPQGPIAPASSDRSQPTNAAL